MEVSPWKFPRRFGTGSPAWQLSWQRWPLQRAAGSPARAGCRARVWCGNGDGALVAFVGLTSHGLTRAQPFSWRGVAPAVSARPFPPSGVLPQRGRDFLHVEKCGGNFCAMERSCVGAAGRCHQGLFVLGGCDPLEAKLQPRTGERSSPECSRTPPHAIPSMGEGVWGPRGLFLGRQICGATHLVAPDCQVNRLHELYPIFVFVFVSLKG